MKLNNNILTEMVKKELFEKRVKLSTMKDANFEPGRFVQLMGKKGMVKLDKKSVHSLAKIVRQLSGKKGMGWSFTMGEGKNKGLWHNIHKKRKRGEKPAKKGDKDYPKTLDIEG